MLVLKIENDEKLTLIKKARANYEANEKCFLSILLCSNGSYKE